MFVKKSETIEKINDNKFKEQILSYLKNNKCCKDIFCNHPKHQSDSLLHKHFKVFEDSIKNELNYNVSKLWVFYSKKNEILLENWHKHNNKVSCLMYLTDTKLGTKFENFNIYLNKNCWLVWDEDVIHTPEKGSLNQDRITIAGMLW
jgi:hypothetical protein